MQTFLHTWHFYTDAFRHGRFYTQTFLDRDSFTTKRFRDCFDAQTYTHTHTERNGHTNRHTHTHTHVHTHVHAHTHTDAHAHTHRHTKCVPNLGGSTGVKESMKMKSCCCSTCHGRMDVVICCNNFIHKVSMVWAKKQDREISKSLGDHLISEISSVKGSNSWGSVLTGCIRDGYT